MNPSAQLLSLSFIALLITACSTTDDPTQGGFIGGVYGITSGAYDKRIETRENNLAAIQQAGKTGEAEKRVLQTERTVVKNEHDSLVVQLNRVQGDTRKLSAQLSRLQVTTAEMKNKRNQLTQKVNKINGEIKKLRSTTANSNPAETQAQQARVTQLEKEMQQLWEIYETLK